MRYFAKYLIVIFVAVAMSYSLANDENIGESYSRAIASIEHYDTEFDRILLNDKYFYLERFTIVQNYGDPEDTRLPKRSLKEGSWVLIEFNYSMQERKDIVSKIQIVPFESVQSLIRTGAADE